VAHVAYSPVGYAYNADDYCLDCIPKVIAGSHGGIRPGHCNCAECRLDRIAKARGIDRMDESSYDMSVFPKSIAYFNDLHSDCELEESWDEHWNCYGHCAECGDIIDGTERGSGATWAVICPGEDQYLDRLAAETEDDDE